MKITAVACSNIALVKYWGKRDETLKIPQNSSISITMDKLLTTTTVNFDSNYRKDEYHINGEKIQADDEKKLNSYMNTIRKMGKTNTHVKVESKTNFPTAAGLASSASGFAALAVASSKALDLQLSERDLSILARRGSGSACRSVPGGFVEWHKGETQDGSDSYAEQLAPKNHWDIQLIIAISSFTKKKVPSTTAMRDTVKSSPYYRGWLDSIEEDLEKVREGIKSTKIRLVGETAERNCLKMHALMLTTVPSLIYWNETTVRLIKDIQDWRDDGFNCYFTIDAGPNVVVLCPKDEVLEITKRIQKIKTIQKIIASNPGPAPFLSENHLF